MLSVASIHCIHNYMMPKFTLLIPYIEQTTWRWQNKLDSLFKIHIPIWFFAHHLLMMCTDSQCIMFFGVGGAMDWEETPTLLGGDRGPCFYTKGNAFNCNSVTSLNLPKAFESISHCVGTRSPVNSQEDRGFLSVHFPFQPNTMDWESVY